MCNESGYNYKYDLDIVRLVEYINNKFRHSIMRNDFRSHIIFHAGTERGGSDPEGGIFWCDYSVLSRPENEWYIPQIVGHTPTMENNAKHTWNLNLINIDTGLYRLYGGNKVYLEIDPQGIIIQHSKDNRGWTVTILDKETEYDLSRM